MKTIYILQDSKIQRNSDFVFYKESIKTCLMDFNLEILTIDSLNIDFINRCDKDSLWIIIHPISSNRNIDYLIMFKKTLSLIINDEFLSSDPEKNKNYFLISQNYKSIIYFSEFLRDSFFEKFNLNKELISSNIILPFFSFQIATSILNIKKNKGDSFLIIKDVSCDRSISTYKNSIKWCEDNSKKYQTFDILSKENIIDHILKNKGIVFLPDKNTYCPFYIFICKILNLEIITNNNLDFSNSDILRESSKNSSSILIENANKFRDIIYANL